MTIKRICAPVDFERFSKLYPNKLWTVDILLIKNNILLSSKTRYRMFVVQ